ncbi:MAG: phosphomethylpyrimidine synthase ThiC [bacterium]|nr:phosphomethylpyrimidine synthase ThiC [bacterium]
MTQRERAIKGEITDEVKYVAEKEGIDPEVLRTKIATGKVVIPHNINHALKKFCGIGEGLRTKVNANIGTSPDGDDYEMELKKARVAISAGADCLMDLSIGGNIDKVRMGILKMVDVPLGTVPIYQAALEGINSSGSIMDMTSTSILKVIERQAQDGVDFMTIHAGVTREVISSLKKVGRVLDIVSRGGAFLVEWMVYHNKENPLYENFSQILDIAKAFDVTLSLGDGLRPGAISDGTDAAQIQELIVLSELTQDAWSEGVQVMIEGPGHLPLHQIEANVRLQKGICKGAPFYVLGPLVTDVTPGYDHISAAIGGAIAAWAGADFLCYVTPGEHLRLPTLEDVKEGVIATRISAHSADIAKGIKNAIDWDYRMSRERKKLNWEGQKNLSIDPTRVSEWKGKSKSDPKACTMCGKYCAIEIVNKYLKQEVENR